MPQRASLLSQVVTDVELLDQHQPQHDLVHEQQLSALLALIRDKETSVDRR